MTKSDFDIGDQVAFSDEKGRKVGRIVALGSQATVQIWNTGDFEVSYAKLTLTKKKSHRKKPSKATRALRSQTGSATVVAAKQPKAARKKAAKQSWAEKQAAKYAAQLPEEGFDLFSGTSEPEWDSEAYDLQLARQAAKDAKKKGKRAAAPKAPKKGKRKPAPQSVSPKQVRLVAKGGGEKQAVRQWNEEIPNMPAEAVFAALQEYRDIKGSEGGQFDKDAYLEVLDTLRTFNFPAREKRVGKRKLQELEPSSTGALAAQIDAVSASLLIHKKDRPSVRAIAEKIIANEGFSESAVQAAAVIHFGPRSDAPKFIQRMDRATVRKFTNRYAIRGGSVQSKADIVRAGGKVKLKKMSGTKVFADYVHKNWGGWEHYVYVIWPEFHLDNAGDKAAFRTLSIGEAGKFIRNFEKKYESKVAYHTPASAFIEAEEKLSKGAKQGLAEARKIAKIHASRAEYMRRHQEAIDNPGKWTVEGINRAIKEAGGFARISCPNGGYVNFRHSTFTRQSLHAASNCLPDYFRRYEEGSWKDDDHKDMGWYDEITPAQAAARGYEWWGNGIYDSVPIHKLVKFLNGEHREKRELPTLSREQMAWKRNGTSEKRGGLSKKQVQALDFLAASRWSVYEHRIPGKQRSTWPLEAKGLIAYKEGSGFSITPEGERELVKYKAAHGLRLKSLTFDSHQARSNPPKRARPANRRALRRGQTVEWVDRRGVSHQGVVDAVHARSSTVISAMTMKYSEQPNRDLYPFKSNGYTPRRKVRSARR